MWGQRLKARPLCREPRNTPTYVGTTEVIGWKKRFWKEHPHVCGDNLYASECQTFQEGTPPRMWGQRKDRDNGHILVKEHPHVCGDNSRAHWS